MKTVGVSIRKMTQWKNLLAKPELSLAQLSPSLFFVFFGLSFVFLKMAGQAGDFSFQAQFFSMFILVYVPITYYLARTQSEKNVIPGHPNLHPILYYKGQYTLFDNENLTNICYLKLQI